MNFYQTFKKCQKYKTSSLFWCIMFLSTKTIAKKGRCLMDNSIYHSQTIYNCLKQLNLCRIFPHTAVKHILAILISVFSYGYRGKTRDFERCSPCHRTTIAHFLNKGKWDDSKLENVLKASVVQLSSRCGDYSPHPSTEPNVRLSRIRLFAKLIVPQPS